MKIDAASSCVRKTLIGMALLLGLGLAWACRGQELSPEERQVKRDLELLRDAVVRYIAAHQGAAPEALEALLPRGQAEKSWLKEAHLPLDPWQRPYLYAPPTNGAPYNIRCLGRDGFEGGRAADADIDLNMLRDKRI